MKISEAIKSLNKVMEFKGDVEIGNIVTNLFEIEEIKKSDVVLDFLKYISDILSEKNKMFNIKMEKSKIELDFWKKLIEISEYGISEEENNSNE